MGKPKLGISKNRKKMHYSIGAIILKKNKYLLIDRATPPLGFACIAGHIDENESPEQALVREIKEESGLDVEGYKLLFKEELDWNWCSKGIEVHYWYVYKCKTSGEIKFNNKETKSIGYYTQKQIKEFSKNKKLEAVWEYWFRKLNII